MLLLPDYGVAVFAFANRTYAGPSPAVWQAAVALHQQGLLSPRTLAVSAALAANYRAAQAMWTAGNLTPGQGHLAMNFLMDRSPDNWKRKLAGLKEKLPGW